MSVKAKKNKFDYNYIVIALCFLTTVFGLGIWGNKGYFVNAVTDALDISRTLYSFIETIRYITSILVSLLMIFFLSKLPTKVILLIGMFMQVVSAIINAFATNIFIFYLGAIALGIGLLFTGTSVFGYIVNKITVKNRGLIMGFILAGNGIGGALGVQIIAPLITGSTYGYKNAYFIMACIFAIMFLILLLFYREPNPHNEDVTEITPKKRRGNSWVGIEVSEALKKPYFYLACICIFLTGLALQGIVYLKTPHVQLMGIDDNFYKNTVSICSILLTVSKIFNGYMYDRIGLRPTITIDCLAGILMMVMMYIVNDSTLGYVLVATMIIPYAIALPLETVIVPIYANDLFGDKAYTKILAIFTAVNQAGFALGSIVINVFYDIFMSYHVSILVCIGALSIATITLQFIITSANKVRKKVMLENQTNKENQLG